MSIWKKIKGIFVRSKSKNMLDNSEFTFTCNIKVKGEWLRLMVSNNALSFNTMASDGSHLEFGQVRLYNRAFTEEDFKRECDSLKLDHCTEI